MAFLFNCGTKLSNKSHKKTIIQVLYRSLSHYENDCCDNFYESLSDRQKLLCERSIILLRTLTDAKTTYYQKLETLQLYKDYVILYI